MSNLNKKKVSLVPPREMGLSGTGNVQFVKTDLQKVLEAVVTAIYGVDTLYQSADDKIATLKSAMRGVIKANGQVGMDVLARMALWARHKVGLRTMPMVMGVSLFEIAREFKLKFDHDRRFVSLLIKRADELTDFLGFEIEDLFDVNELLRGKSLEMYQILYQGRDEKGRFKITQPELMKQTGIKNRRTFYKHEQWLINLHLLEKRHLPGDHKGVVYRIFEISEVLPVPSELVEQFEKILKTSE